MGLGPANDTHLHELLVPIAGVGHGDSRGKEPNQLNADCEPRQKDNSSGGPETSLDLSEGKSGFNSAPTGDC